MAISYQSIATVNNPSPNTAITISRPSGTGLGALLYAAVCYAGSGVGVPITPPSGWTQLQATNTGNTSHDLQFYTYYKYATSSEPSTFTWTLGGSGVQSAGMILLFQGVDAVSAIDVLSYKQGQGPTASLSAATTTVSNAWLLFTCGFAADIPTGMSFPTPSGYTNRSIITNAGEAELQCSSLLQAVAGSTGTTSLTTDAAADDWWAVHLTVLKPDVPSTAPIIAAGSNLTNRMRALRATRGQKTFCGWMVPADAPGTLMPSVLLPWTDLPVKPPRRARLGWQRGPAPNDNANPPTPSPISTGSIEPRISLPPQSLPDDEQWKRQTAAWMAEANQGHLNNTGIVTLSENQNSTVVVDDRAGKDSFIGFSPNTANAAAEQRNGSMFVTNGKGTFTVFHSNNAQTDRTFTYTILG